MHLYIRGKKNNIQYSTIIFAWVHVLYNTHAENTLNLKKKKKVYMYIYKFLDNCDKKVEIEPTTAKSN